MPHRDSGIKGLFVKTWNRVLCSSPRKAAVALLLVFLLGVIAWGGFNWSLELTNSESFCISCHEMEKNVYREYRHTVHYSNRTGVRATCPDCHVPREWMHMVVRKITATNELFQKIRGTIDTRKKFLARRPELVKAVWQTMRQSDSSECRNCHNFTFMDTRKQEAGAAKIHLEARQTGKTCIDCHMGIAHELPEGLMDSEHERFKRQGQECRMCHIRMAQIPTDEEWDWD